MADDHSNPDTDIGKAVLLAELRKLNAENERTLAERDNNEAIAPDAPRLHTVLHVKRCEPVPHQWGDPMMCPCGGRWMIVGSYNEAVEVVCRQCGEREMWPD